MEYKYDDRELSEEELINVTINREFLLERPDEVEKIFGNRSKKELESIKQILESRHIHKYSFRKGRR